MASNRIRYLPVELVDEILLRLAVKDLLVYKCVCKDWYALIKSPSFVNRHYSHENNQGLLCFLHFTPADGDVEDEFEYSMYDDGRHSLVEAPDHLRQMSKRNVLLGPEKGIFCVTEAFSTRICLLNIATIELKILPPHPLNDPVKGWPIVGFGLDPSSGDFKVVAFEKSKSQSSAFVYNLSCDSWKRIETMGLLDKIVYFDCMGIPVVNGVQHWRVKFDDHDAQYSILAFDMRSDKFRVIAIPDALRNPESWFKISAYGDSIAVLSITQSKCVDMWVMGSDGLWSKNFCVGPFEKLTRPICVWKMNKMFLGFLSSPLVMCDISTQKVTTILPGMSGEPLFTFVMVHFMYKESLVSIKGERAKCIQDLF